MKKPGLASSETSRQVARASASPVSVAPLASAAARPSDAASRFSVPLRPAAVRPSDAMPPFSAPRGSAAFRMPDHAHASSAARVARRRPRRPTPESRHPARATTDSTHPAARGHVRHRLAFDHLGEREVSVAYEVHGGTHGFFPTVPGPAARGRRPATAIPTLVLGGISAGRHLGPASFDATPGWWPGVVGPGLALDPALGPLLGIDYLGGKVDGNRLLRPVTTHDQARAIAAVLDHLGIERASFVGASYGGMVALAFAELFPERTGRMVILCAAHRTHPMATAVRSVQRAAVALGADSGDAARGLSLARALAMTTYRSAREFEERFSPVALSAGTPGGDPSRFPVEDYLEARGADFVSRFDIDRFLALSESIDLHGTRSGSLPEHAVLVSFDTDVLVPAWLMDELAARGSEAEPGRCAARHVTIPSLYGHDAFLKESAAVTELLRSELDEAKWGEGAAAGPAARTQTRFHQEELTR